MTEGQKIREVAKILKRHFTNLTVDQTIDIAVEIVEAIFTPAQAVDPLGLPCRRCGHSANLHNENGCNYSSPHMGCSCQGYLGGGDEQPFFTG